MKQKLALLVIKVATNRLSCLRHLHHQIIDDAVLGDHEPILPPQIINTSRGMTVSPDRRAPAHAIRPSA